MEDKRNGFPTQNFSREPVSGSEISNRAPEAAFTSHVASWMDHLGYGTEIATVNRGAF